MILVKGGIPRTCIMIPIDCRKRGYSSSVVYIIQYYFSQLRFWVII